MPRAKRVVEFACAHPPPTSASYIKRDLTNLHVWQNEGELEMWGDTSGLTLSYDGRSPKATSLCAVSGVDLLDIKSISKS